GRRRATAGTGGTGFRPPAPSAPARSRPRAGTAAARATRTRRARRAARAAREVDVPEPGEAPPQRDVLQRPDLAVLNARGDTHGVEARAQRGLERLLAADLHEIFDAIERDELRVDRHRAQRR